MKNKDDAITSDIKIEQLLPERSFIEYCNFDYHRQQKLNINPEFLRAAEVDNFLFPLLQRSEAAKQEDGTEKEITTNYYSPHQIYVIAALSKNQVHQGLLWENRDLELYKQQGFRMVNWGWSRYAFNINLSPKSKGLKIVNQKQLGDAQIVTVEVDGEGRKDPNLDHVKVCNDFQNFLMLLHSLEQLQYSSTNNRAKDRYFSQAPSLHFNLSPLRTEGDKMLKKYGLDLGKLKILTHNVARLASEIDPLEHWYYYINRHPQWRKDLFKGDAALAQELYRIYDLLVETIEVVSSEKQPPMFELMYGEQNINPYLIPRIEYVNGTDVMSMWATIKKFKEWANLGDNKAYVLQSTLDWLEIFEKELKDYEKRYGARSFPHTDGWRFVEVEEEIKIENLNPKTKNSLDQIIQQAKAQQLEGKHQFLSLMDDELEERVKKDEITADEAKKLDEEYFMKREIFDAIERRLDSLKRELWQILDFVHDNISKKVDDAWDKERNIGNWFWFNNDKIKGLSREKQIELYQSEYDKTAKEAREWSKRRDGFGQIQFTMNLFFCSSCRQKPVAKHQSHNDGQISNNPICDDCINSTVDLRTLGSEMKCDFCGKLLYKFANRNILNDLLFNAPQSTATLTLEYGRLQVKIKCPNKDCAEYNTKWIDWGWLP